MIATIFNVFTVILGSFLGLFIRNGIKENLKEVVYTSVGLISLLIGLTMGMEGEQILFILIAVILGGFIGEALDIEGKIIGFGDLFKERILKTDKEENFGYAFLTATMLFCVGAMTLIGSFKAGAEGDYTLILTKSVMDGFMAVILTAALGSGVMLSAVFILLYQGGLTLLAETLRPWVTEIMISEISGVGGILIMMIGLNLLKLREVKTANFTPAFLVIILFVLGYPLLENLPF